jgi:hypothetical protein
MRSNFIGKYDRLRRRATRHILRFAHWAAMKDLEERKAAKEFAEFWEGKCYEKGEGTVRGQQSC